MAEVEIVHQGLLVGIVLFGERFGGFAVVIVRILKEHWEEVFDGLAFAVPHCVHCSEHGFRDELVTQPAPFAVATDDTQHLPIAQFVQELMARDAYLTHKEFIDCPRRG